MNRKYSSFEHVSIEEQLKIVEERKKGASLRSIQKKFCRGSCVISILREHNMELDIRGSYKKTPYPKNKGEFVARSKKVHEEKYSYKAVKFISYDKKVNIICPIHGSFYQLPNSHLIGHGCSDCAQSEAWKTRINQNIKRGSLLKLLPRIASELVIDKNQKLRPEELPSFGTKIYRWKCNRGHVFKASISQRRDGRECTICNKGKQSSILEIRTYCELKKIFKNVHWRHQLFNKEVDVFIKPLKLAIEIDGYPWHMSKYNDDLYKASYLKNRNIKVLRIRDDKLRIIEGAIQWKYSSRNIIQPVIQLLKRIRKYYAPKKYLKLLDKHIAAECFLNEAEFNQIYSYFPNPFEEDSIARDKKLKKEFDLDTNSPLTPEMFSRGSNSKVWWKCGKGHSWQTTVAHRATSSTNCPECHRSKKHKVYDLESFLLEAEKKHGNTYDYSRVNYKNTKTSVVIICRTHGNFTQLPGLHAASGQGCPKCIGRHKTNSEVINEARKMHGRKYDYSKLKYSGAKTKMKIICDKHGDFFQTYSGHIGRGTGCPSCNRWNARKVKIRGICYDSIAAACNALSITAPVVFKRMRKTGDSANKCIEYYLQYRESKSVR
ncbi:zinc-ribbon domain-containing protein [bacterium]|nr:zinc-ribbon domain-containing protein [bacterium]